MPDWRNADHYSFPNNFPAYRWAWEFLRRNPDYRKDWADAISRFSTEKDVDSPSFYLRGTEKDKWSLTNGLLNPNTDAPRFLSFNLDPFGTVHLVSKHDKPFSTDTRYPVAVFDLKRPLKPQMTMALVNLEKLQKTLNLTPVKLALHRKLWPRYIRLLDAELDQRTPPQISRVLAQEGDQDAADKDANDELIREQIQAAKRMTLPDDRGYLSIFLSPSDYVGW